MKTLIVHSYILFVINCWGQEIVDVLFKWQEFESNYIKFNQENNSISAQSQSLSETEKINEIRLYLYPDIKNKFYAEEINPNQLQTLAASQFKYEWDTKIFIHGFEHNYNCSFPQDLKNLYLQLGLPYNYLAVNWGPLAMNLAMNSAILPFNEKFQNYYTAVNNVPLVGQQMGNFISNLWLISRYDPAKVHIVGFSLGAHVSGHAGDQVYKNINQKVGRITGLDPAGPLYISGLVGRHLNSADATYVDFVHTDMGQSGTIHSLGHSNFFVNGGKPKQPGCLSYISQQTELTEILPIAFLGSCSHNTAHLYYAQSVTARGGQIVAQKCLSYVAYKTGLCQWNTVTEFGEYSNHSTRGHFYLEMVPAAPNSTYVC